MVSRSNTTKQAIQNVEVRGDVITELLSLSNYNIL